VSEPLKFQFENKYPKSMSDPSEQKKEAFSQKMAEILNAGALNLAMAIGYRMRLFDIMDSMQNPSTAKRIARKAGLSPRYVEEWLGVMVCGGIVELVENDNGDDLYHLPTEHGDLITQRAGHQNLGVYTQEIPLLTHCALESVIHGFSSGEGVPYDRYPKFQNFMAQLANAKHRRMLVNIFLPSVDDGRLVQKLRTGIRVCDLGCAEGIAILLMAEAFPNSQFFGIDIDSEVIESANQAAREKGLSNVSFSALDAANIAEDKRLSGTFDYVTAFDAIHDQTRPLDALKGVLSLLKPDGLFSMVDIAASSFLSNNVDHPMGTFLYTVSLMHCLPVGLVDSGMGLGMMWGRERAVDMLHDAGFNRVEVIDIPDDPFNLHFMCRR